MKRHATAAPKARAGQLVLSPTQVGLVLGFGIVGLLMAFGTGFMVGTWFQASEQLTPYDAGLTPGMTPSAPESPMSFYSTLTEPRKRETLPYRRVDEPPSRIPRAFERNIAPSGTHYSVQVGSFRAREQAEQLHDRLTQKGYAVRIQSSQVPGKGLWYRVQVGKFATRAAADRTAQRLVSQEHLSVMIMDASR